MKKNLRGLNMFVRLKSDLRGIEIELGISDRYLDLLLKSDLRGIEMRKLHYR